MCACVGGSIFIFILICPCAAVVKGAAGGRVIIGRSKSGFGLFALPLLLVNVFEGVATVSRRSNSAFSGDDAAVVAALLANAPDAS